MKQGQGVYSVTYFETDQLTNNGGAVIVARSARFRDARGYGKTAPEAEDMLRRVIDARIDANSAEAEAVGVGSTPQPVEPEWAREPATIE